MNGEVFEFNRQEKKGKVGESKIINAWPELFEWSDVNEYDLIYIPEDSSVEVKTETNYSLETTPNFFMEKYSDDIKFKLGGPFRAEKDNVDIFISYFIQNGVIFWFNDLKSLVKRCEEGILKFNVRPSYVKNKGYYTIGYPIRRYWFEDLFREIKLGDEI